MVKLGKRVEGPSARHTPRQPTARTAPASVLDLETLVVRLVLDELDERHLQRGGAERQEGESSEAERQHWRQLQPTREEHKSPNYPRQPPNRTQPRRHATGVSCIIQHIRLPRGPGMYGATRIWWDSVVEATAATNTHEREPKAKKKGGLSRTAPPPWTTPALQARLLLAPSSPPNFTRHYKDMVWRARGAARTAPWGGVRPEHKRQAKCSPHAHLRRTRCCTFIQS